MFGGGVSAFGCVDVEHPAAINAIAIIPIPISVVFFMCYIKTFVLYKSIF